MQCEIVVEAVAEESGWSAIGSRLTKEEPHLVLLAAAAARQINLPPQARCRLLDWRGSLCWSWRSRPARSVRRDRRESRRAGRGVELNEALLRRGIAVNSLDQRVFACVTESCPVCGSGAGSEPASGRHVLDEHAVHFCHVLRELPRSSPTRSNKRVLVVRARCDNLLLLRLDHERRRASSWRSGRLGGVRAGAGREEGVVFVAAGRRGDGDGDAAVEALGGGRVARRACGRACEVARAREGRFGRVERVASGGSRGRAAERRPVSCARH